MKTNSKTRILTINALLLAIGAMLHQITPALGLPMQPDFALVMMIIIMVINKGDYKNTLVCAVITGIFTAMTTKFPGGQLPNVIDKLVTANLVYILICMLQRIKFSSKLKQNKFITTTVLPIGTLVSGVVFLVSAQIIVGLPAPFIILFSTIVLPTVAINTISGLALYKVINLAFRRSRSYS